MPDSRGSTGDGTGKSPDAYRTISEVSQRLDVPQHVLRFWETRFPQIKPLKRAGGRRHYRPDDIALLARIRALLHDEGYSIKGVQRLLKTRGVRGLIDDGRDDSRDDSRGDAGPEDTAPGMAAPHGPTPDHELRGILAELVSMRDLLR